MDAAATAAAVRACVLFVQCNPLLDCSVDVDEAFLQRHGVQLGSSYVYTNSDDKCPHKALFDELLIRQRDSGSGSDGDVVYSAGGAGLNTARVAQWVLRANAAAAATTQNDGDDAAVATAPHEGGGAVVFAGCVGDDAAATQLRRAAARDGVVAVWQVAPAGQHTGRCVVLHCGGARALVAEVGAAACLRVDCLDTAPMHDALAAARVVYTTLYSATPSHAQHAMKLAASTRSSNSTATACATTTTSTSTSTTTQPLRRTAFAIALSAREVLGAFAEDLVDFLEKLDLVFCNRGELRDLAMLLQLVPDEMSERELVAAVAQSMPYDKHLPQRYVVVTRGAQPVLCATNNGDVVEVPVVALPRQQQCASTATATAAAAVTATSSSRTRRATGAGDAFVGGFLAAWIAGCAVVQCCHVGAQCAAFVMQHGMRDLQLAAAPRLRAPTQ